MLKLLNEWIYSIKSDFGVTFNRPPKREEYEQMIELVLDIIYEKKVVDSKNIKTFTIKDFELAFFDGESVKYIQKMPNRGKSSSII